MRIRRTAPKILFEDDDLLVVLKPAGMVVNRARSVKGETLQDWLEEKVSFLKGWPGSDWRRRGGIVHRLDKETSGLLLVAKTEESFADLQSQFKKREVKKEYLGLVHGWMEPRRGRVDLPIKRSPFNRKKFGVFLGGRRAETGYETIRRLAKRGAEEEKFSLLALFPKTGRTHQLRVHLRQTGHPLVADPIYGGRKNYRRDKVWCPRLFLHAKGIEFRHLSGKKMKFSTALTDDLKEAMRELKEE